MGFPTRPSRASFGPAQYQNKGGPVKGRVRNPQEEIDAPIVNLFAWQLAGAGLMVPLAWCVVDGVTGDMLGGHEAWDPYGSFVPEVGRDSDGAYTVEYPVSVANESGALVPLSFIGATVSIGGTSVFPGVRVPEWRIVDGRTIEVLTKTTAGTLIDVPRFLLQVW